MSRKVYDIDLLVIGENFFLIKINSVKLFALELHRLFLVYCIYLFYNRPQTGHYLKMKTWTILLDT